MRDSPPDTWLILETSGRTGHVALAHGSTLVRDVTLDSARRHARDLAATVCELLRLEGLTPKQLTGVMVSVGPGSYTGLRVGIVSAKAFAYATGCPLVAVPTFAAVADQAPPGHSRQWVLADALQGMVYRQAFERTADGWSAVSELSIALLQESLPEFTAGTILNGPGVGLLGTVAMPGVAVVPEADRLPRAESVWRVGLRTPPLTRENLFALEPLYLRGSSAEEKAKGG